MSTRKIFKRNQGATSSPKSRLLGLATLFGLVTLFVFAFFLTDPDVRLHPTTGEEIGQFDAVRLLYLHVPMAIIGPYVAPLVGAVASVGYLINSIELPLKSSVYLLTLPSLCSTPSTSSTSKAI